GHREQEDFLALNLKKIRRKFSRANAYFFSVSQVDGDIVSSAPAVSSSPNPTYSRANDYSFSLSQEKGNVGSSAPAISSSPNPTQSDGAASKPLDGASGPLESNALSFPLPDYLSTAPGPLGELKKIHRARRDPRVPFGDWDYGLGAPLGECFAFSCKTWEALLRHPEEAWYRHLLGQGDFWDFSGSDWRRVALGTWVHDFLHFPEASEGAVSLPEAAEGCALIQTRAERFWKNTEAFFAKRGRKIPLVWEMLWREALALAQRLFRRVAQWGKSCPFRSEFALPEGSHLSFASGHTLALSGRIDLCLERGTQNWIVDYKTGGDRPLTRRAWHRFNTAGQALVSAQGLQLLLYGLALRSSGWKNIYLWVLRPDAPVGEEEAEAVCLETLEGDPAFRKFWDVFEKRITGGILGLWPASRSSPKRCRRPLAVLPIEEAVLRQRCLKTFACLWE
ncbi:MAG: PD-(D/E)XK nuclease family protein, partial [Puniceicoccales bacterium]|nr:PD-(D/E)XK nuclease family protein [Puniceicoccales bacterium]